MGKGLNAVTVIRHRGDPMKATTLLGQEVVRRKSIPVEALKGNIPCAPYDNHFIYETDPRIKHIPSHMCTCGSPAVIINPTNRKTRMFVCLLHASTGQHTTGG